jgi:hypothetical protein
MSFHKDLWMDAYEARVAELEDQGLSYDAALAQAGEEDAILEDRVKDRIADMTDHARDLWKERNL